MSHHGLACGIVAAVALGCAAGELDPDGEDGRGDDLLGKSLTFETGAAIAVSFPSDHLVEPTVHESGHEILIRTADLRIERPEEAFEVAIAAESLEQRDSKYGFKVQFWDPTFEVWRTIHPLGTARQSERWFWERVSVESFVSNPDHGWLSFVFTGDAVQYRDVVLGLTHGRREARVESLRWDLPGAPEVRVLVTPLWNFWNWDETGYAATVQFR